MNPPLKISASITIDPSQAKVGAKEAQAAIGGIGRSAEDASMSLKRLIETSVGIGGGAANNNIREWSGALAMAGRSADELRAKYNPLFATISEYKQSVIEIKTLTAQGILTTDEMTAAIQRQRQATLASIDAIKGRNSAMHASGPAGSNFAATNAMFQFQDIAMTSAMGMNPLMVGLQQGSQLAGGFAGMSIKEAGAAAIGGIAGMLNPLSLVTIGTTVAASAAISYFSRIEVGTDSSAEALRKHRADIIEAAKAWTTALPELKKYTDELERKNTLEEQKGLAKTIREDIYAGAKKVYSPISVEGADVLGRLQDFGTDAAQVLKLAQSMRQLDTDIGANKATLEETQSIQQQLSQLYAQTGIPAVLKLSEAYKTLGEEVAKAAAQARQIDAELTPDRTPNGLLRGMGRSSEGLGLTKSIAETRDQIRQAQGEYDQWLLSLNAKSPAEKAAAARAAEKIRPLPSNEIGNPELTQQRIELAGKKALAEAEKELTDARRDRARSIAESLTSSRLELTLIGQTTSSMEAQRMELRLLTEAKDAAEKSGSTVSEAEIEQIKKAAAEYGRLQEAIKSTNILRDQDDNLRQLRLEISLVGQSEAVRARALALAQAEKMIRDQGITATSKEAQAIRDKSTALAENNLKLDRLHDAWNTVQSSGENAIDAIGEAIRTGDWAGAVNSVLADIQKSFITLGFTNPLKNALFGTNYGTLSDAGGLIGSLIGGSSLSTASTSSIGAMNVNAATVVINGGIGAGGLLGGIPGVANDNLSGLGASLTNQGGVGAQIWNFFAGKGLKDFQIAGIMGNIARESSFNPTAVGDGGNALGLFQWNDRAPSMLSAIGGRGNLGNVQAQLGYAWKELQTTESGALSRLLKSTNLQDATSAFAGFERPRGWSLQNPEGADGFSARLSGAEQALAKFGSSANGASTASDALGRGLGGATDASGKLGSGLNSAASGLNQLGSGLDRFGQALASAQSGGNTGLASLLGSFTKVGIGAFNTSAQFQSAVLSGIPGLWADGGFTGNLDEKSIAGYVHGGEFVFSKRAVDKLGLGYLDAMHREARAGYASGGYVSTPGNTWAAWANSSQSQPAPAPVAPVIQIIDRNNSNVKVRDRSTANGVSIEVMIDEAVAENVSKIGSNTGRALTSQFGLNRGLSRR